MARIKKTATARHEPSLSTAIAEFAKATTSIPLYQLPAHLASFPKHWPFPRGDLYHWINVLNRFDRILELFIDEYSLSDGPQVEPFGRRLLLKGDSEDPSDASAAPTEEVLDKLGFSEEADRELVEALIRFTRLLLENCGNRNLYASSARLNLLLNTTSLSLLKATLRLTHRLAQRYHATRTRMQSNSVQNQILTSHYALNLDNLQKMAAPFPKGTLPPAPAFNSPAAKGKDKSGGTERSPALSRSNAANIVALVQDDESTRNILEEFSTVSLSYYEKEPQPAPSNPPEPSSSAPQAPATPTPVRRSSNFSPNQTSRAGRTSGAEQASPTSFSSPIKSDPAATTGLRTLEIPQSKISSMKPHELLKETVQLVPEQSRFDLLHRIRVSSALSSSRAAREDIVAIRLLAVANLANIYPETLFQQKISTPDSDEPRRFQLPYQLAELIQPHGKGEHGPSRELQTLALLALDSLTMHKSKGPDVVAALSVNVNHGVLFYVLRKAVAELSSEDADQTTPFDDEYRDALFSLLLDLPGAQPRTGDSMVSAGILDILVEILNLRTPKAERAYSKVLDFLNMYVYHIRDAFQALVSAKGLEAVANLTSFEVESSFSRAQKGEGLPEAHKTQYTDYKIPWHQQQTLRQVLKFLNHMLSHTSTNFDRMLRNLIDSPQLLGALRTIIENGSIFGSHVWSSAVSIVTNFIHHEPTSYAVIAEAGLSKSFLESVTQRPLPEKKDAEPSTSGIVSDNENQEAESSTAGASVEASDSRPAPSSSGLRSELVIQSRQVSNTSGILPNADAILAIPTAFGAICLNESGMESFQNSGALQAFFEIFESESHVKAMDGDTDVAGSIGNNFDELVRHHPALKDAILDSVKNLVKRIGTLAFNRVKSQGVGTKLWIEGEDSKAHVAGGRAALLGEWDQSDDLVRSSGPSKADNEDVEMRDVEQDSSKDNSDVSIDEIIDSEDGKDGPTTSQYISVVCQFLGGFFTNASLCAAFAESDALEYLLDFTTIPSLPYNVNDDVPGNLIVELERVIQPLVEQKPHLILPSLLKRAQKAADTLEPFLQHEEQEAFFAPFTSREAQSSPAAKPRIENGTRFAKALVSIHVLCSLLSFSFQGQMFNQRTTHNIFSQVNLADMYARFISSLGRLHRSCLWEEVLLQKNMPRSWEKLTRVKGLGLSWGAEGDELQAPAPVEPSPTGNTNAVEAGEPNATGQPQDQPTTANAEGESESTDSVDENSVYFKNTRVLRFLLSKVPTSIHPFIQNLGRILLYRRSLDGYHKQCSFIVAHQIAKACLDQLTFAPPKNTPSPKDRYPYWISIFSSISRLLIDDSMERGHPMVLTLILDCFKRQGGFGVLEEILQSLTEHVTSITDRESDEKLPPDVQAILDLALGGIKTILEFYSQVINHKYVTEANQTTAMQSRPDRDRDKPDFFLAPQFLVELRFMVLKPVQRIWQSNLIDKATTSIVKSLVDALKIILEGEGEHGAFKRSDKPSKRSRAPVRPWKPRTEDHVKRLQEDADVDADLAREALFRCYDNLASAREYCHYLQRNSRATRNPIPQYELEAEERSRERQSTLNPEQSASNDSLGASTSSESSHQAAATHESTTNAQASSAEDVPMASSRPATSEGSSFTFTGPSLFTEGRSDASTQIYTIDDLDEERAELRKALIDRALEVLNVHDDVTFELSDLITSATSKASDPSALRAEIGVTLLQFLVSLQNDEDFRPDGKKIAASAHLLALLLQNKQFYEATVDELKENFATLLGFIKIFPGQATEEPSPWVGHVLLIMEKLLAEDCEPTQIQWTPPTNDEPVIDEPISNKDLVVSMEEKNKLFEAVVSILPRIGKDESLAISITRILCILTRYREIAVRLSEKRNIQKLFLMIKQLAGRVTDKLQAAFMQVLRHIVEDDETIRNIMRSEIQAMFESRDRRQIDTTAYIRSLYHFAIRSPEIFVEVTNEKLMLQRYDPNQRPQHLALKKDKPSNEESNDESTPAIDDSTVAEKKPETVRTTTEEKMPDASDKTKASESKHPIVENPDGVIHYLLCELLAYKDVEDKEPSVAPPESSKESASGDVEMTNGETASNASTSAQSNEASESKKSDKPEFKADEHPIFMYRCFILQCLAELLACYNRTKIEFVNFSRKADPHATTPSKPRSGVLNYLLNTLVPVNTLSHAEDIAFRKRYATSTWAVSVIVSLLSRTEEKGFARGREGKEAEDDPELNYVRRFVLEHALKAFKDASTSHENLDTKYSKMMNLADLFSRILQGRQLSGQNSSNSQLHSDIAAASKDHLGRIMYEKNFIPALTSAIADIDLNFPNAKRAVKYILRPLNSLTSVAVDLSLNGSIDSIQVDDADISSEASSVSDADDREQTPDLFRNSTLAMFEPGRGEYSESEDSDEDEDGDEIYDGEYDDEYGEEMDYDEDEHADEDVISEPDEELEGIGDGLPGDVPMNVELEIQHPGDIDEDDDEDDMDDDDESIDDEDDEEIDEVMEELSVEEDESGDGEDEDEDEWSDDDGEDYPGQDGLEDDDHPDHTGPLDRLARALSVTGGPDLLNRLDGDLIEMEQEFLEDDMQEDEDEDDEDGYDEGFYYDPDEDEDDDAMGMGFGWETTAVPHRHHHHHPPPPHIRHNPWPGQDRSLLAYRSHRAGITPRDNDNNINPLLHRSGRSSNLPTGPEPVRSTIMTDFIHSFDPTRPPPVSLITNLINAFGSTRGMSGAVRVQIGQDTLGSHWTIDVPPFPGALYPRGLGRGTHEHSARPSPNDPVQAVSFTLTTTAARWQDDARLLFGGSAQQRAERLINSILKELVPPAIEAAKQKAKEAAEKQARKAKEEQEARDRERKEREEREAREKKEREEREAAEAEAAAARAREQAEAEGQGNAEASASQAMEGVEESQSTAPGGSEQSTQPAQRITTTIRGREVDITELGIDMEYLEALPEELREEVLLQQVAERRSQAAASGEAPTDISPEFLEALPEDIRAEILQQEAADRRRREREEARRRAATDGANAAAAARAEEMDAASFLASLDPGLRQAVLMDQDEEVLAQLPFEIAAEARALDHRRLNQFTYDGRYPRTRPAADRNAQPEDQAQEKPKPRPVVQMLDKSGVATLLRLMFIPQQGSAKESLREILVNVCKNRQNRAEVISILLNILQDGTTDVTAVERSFAQLSLRAKQPTAQRTPQPSKKSANHIASLSDMSPLMVVQQCISTLNYLVHFPGSHMSSFFLSEHEVPSSVKTRLKGKGKAKDSKASRYPVNALLSLLDRKIVIESSTVMEQLSILLQMITSPLQALLKKDKEKPGEASEQPKEGTGASTGSNQPEGEATQGEDTTMATAGEAVITGEDNETGSTAKEPAKAEKAAEESTKKSRTLIPPEVPEYNLRLVVNILAARECSSKTFRETLSVINNLSAIPGAKETFGKELIQQALQLGKSILEDLGELVVQISSAKSGMDVQGMALSKFSPASSDQAKLLRVLTALDYLFDPKKAETADKPASNTTDALSSPQKDDILTTLFENPTFGSLWNKLSECLSAIRQRGNMFNVATILLPLIEVLMVVCKNTTLKDVPLAKSHQKDFALTSPPPESKMENLFFTFTEEHRKILNDLVRHNPKLMSGSFSLLVKNSKVLEFDNKRNYFSRRIHSRGSEVRQPHQPLQLSVRRDQVFLDSFKSLYFKTADEMKYGKLSIRFHGEEGVDAGGVTREWFQVLSRQMFNPDYALFIPVASDRTTFHPNRLSSVNQEHLMFFKFIGRIIGKALYEGRVLDCHFSRAVYKRILGKPVGIKDMESLDLDYYKSLLWMLENDITDVMTETFSVQTDDFGETQTIDLIPDGRNVPVTEENKHEYVRLVVEYRLTGSVQEQLENFLTGFHDIIPAELISIFNEQELELLISGLPDIDVDDWKNNTEYHNYTAASPQIQWFWRAVRSFDKEEKAKLLQFVTGTSKVPLNGFKELEGMNGFSKFNIHRDYGHKDRLPSSHTCFNQLDLPEYPSYEKLREQLYTAMTAGSEYFGFA